MTGSFRAILTTVLLTSACHAQVIWQEAEAFADTGGWSNDSQQFAWDLIGPISTGGTGVDDDVEHVIGKR